MMSLLLSLALAATGSDTAQPAKPAKPKKVCEKIEMSGSNVPKRVCRTVTEQPKPTDEAARSESKPVSTGATN